MSPRTVPRSTERGNELPQIPSSFVLHQQSTGKNYVLPLTSKRAWYSGVTRYAALQSEGIILICLLETSLAPQSGVTSYLRLPSSLVLHQQSTAQKLRFTPHIEESLVLRGNSLRRSVERGNHSNMSP
eukprot:scaffold3759_cov124-Skeletonema_dohrnii-CCMP3373.AAC.4